MPRASVRPKTPPTPVHLHTLTHNHAVTMHTCLKMASEMHTFPISAGRNPETTTPVEICAPVILIFPYQWQSKDIRIWTLGSILSFISLEVWSTSLSKQEKKSPGL